MLKNNAMGSVATWCYVKGSYKPSKEDKNALQIVTPQSYQKKPLQGYQDDIRHMGLERMLDLLQDQIYWPGMTREVELYIARCE